MKKILKISVLVLIVAIVSVGLLAACEEPVTPGVPDVQQESNDVFYWAPVAGAEYYVMSVDDGENQTIAATSATVYEDNAEYAAMRFKLDTSALAAGVHSVKFAAGAGELVSDPDTIRKMLVSQVVSTVRWEDCVRNAAKLNVEQFYECGPGGILGGTLKRIDKELPVKSLAEVQDF